MDFAIVAFALLDFAFAEFAFSRFACLQFALSDFACCDVACFIRPRKLDSDLCWKGVFQHLSISHPSSSNFLISHFLNFVFVDFALFDFAFFYLKIRIFRFVSHITFICFSSSRLATAVAARKTDNES